jgi:hypothetical protein
VESDWRSERYCNPTFSAFAPKYRRWISHARTKTAKEFPLMMPYLFVGCDRASFFQVRAINGIDKLDLELGRAAADPRRLGSERARALQ